MVTSKELLARFSQSFLGLEQQDPVATFTGETPIRRRVYLDTTATALMPKMVWQGLEAYLHAASANSHTEAHRAGRDTTQAIEDSRDALGRLVGYNPNQDVVLFTANGATGAANFLARALFPPELRSLLKRFPDGPPADLVQSMRAALPEMGKRALDTCLDRSMVITTVMEHHSNLLPWMEAVGHHNVRAARVNSETGELDLAHLAALLKEHGPKIRLLAISAVSNVTGIANPLRTIAKMAHEVGAQLMVDGAQWVPHAQVRMHTEDPAESIDYLILSGHKMYAPGSRGALVGNLTTLEGARCVTDVGGGMVAFVSIDDFAIKNEVVAREEAGTPNIPGSIAMGLVAEALIKIGMPLVASEEHSLTEKLLTRLSAIEGVRVYGSTDLQQVPRAGVVSFNVDGLKHGLVATYLNDFHNIAVRNGCFCAQPYVKALLQLDDCVESELREAQIQGNYRVVPGMVRASLGVYSTEADIEALGAALEQLVLDRTKVLAAYRAERDGSYRRTAAKRLPATFGLSEYIGQWATRPSCDLLNNAPTTPWTKT